MHVLFKISISSKAFSTLFAVWQVGGSESIGAAPHSLEVSADRGSVHRLHLRCLVGHHMDVYVSLMLQNFSTLFAFGQVGA